MVISLEDAQMLMSVDYSVEKDLVLLVNGVYPDTDAVLDIPPAVLFCERMECLGLVCKIVTDWGCQELSFKMTAIGKQVLDILKKGLV